ncbi:inositol monophosphatase family protein [Demequina soli]|uniref:inositol monophosphatase family protein n=1 Tax=Demequina soli TaxID=1638987 RepID=UPI000AF15407|nr:inositol monophosphatase family protein [Demequina soli]
MWIIDPLDGTREFSEGRADWAVHIALWIAGELALGVVGIPGEDLVLSSADVAAAPEPAEGSPLRLAVSRSRPPAVTEPVRAALDAELLPMGSAGVKIAAVVRGQVDAYVHAGGQYEWDSAAPVALARAAGLHTSRIDGSPLVYNADPYLPDLIVCRPVLAPRILAAISDYTDGDS